MEMINLTHAQLTVPRTGIRVTSYAELPTSRGVAFTADIRQGEKLIGYAENSGRGGATAFVPVNREAFTEFATFVKESRCKGQEVSEEYVLDELVEEYTIGLETERSAKRGETMIRSLSPIDGVMYAVEIYVLAKAPSLAETITRAEKAISRMACEAGTRWEIWDWVGMCWRTVSAKAVS